MSASADGPWQGVGWVNGEAWFAVPVDDDVDHEPISTRTTFTSLAFEVPMVAPLNLEVLSVLYGVPVVDLSIELEDHGRGTE